MHEALKKAKFKNYSSVVECLLEALFKKKSIFTGCVAQETTMNALWAVGWSSASG
jgi:hypothetical protein